MEVNNLNKKLIKMIKIITKMIKLYTNIIIKV